MKREDMCIGSQCFISTELHTTFPLFSFSDSSQARLIYKMRNTKIIESESPCALESLTYLANLKHI